MQGQTQVSKGDPDDPELTKQLSAFAFWPLVNGGLVTPVYWLLQFLHTSMQTPTNGSKALLADAGACVVWFCWH